MTSISNDNKFGSEARTKSTDVNECMMYTSRFEKGLTRILNTIGISVLSAGYRYLRLAIRMAYDSPAKLYDITYDIYPEIANLCHVASIEVEQEIKLAIDSAFHVGTLRALNSIIGCEALNTKKCPTNSELIGVISCYLAAELSAFDDDERFVKL